MRSSVVLVGFAFEHEGVVPADSRALSEPLTREQSRPDCLISVTADTGIKFGKFGGNYLPTHSCNM